MKESLVSDSRKKLVTDAITEAMLKAGITEIIFAYKLNIIPEDTVVVSHLGKESEVFTKIGKDITRQLFNYNPKQPIMTTVNGKLREDVIARYGRTEVIHVLCRCTTYEVNVIHSMTNLELNGAWYDRWPEG